MFIVESILSRSSSASPRKIWRTCERVRIINLSLFNVLFNSTQILEILERSVEKTIDFEGYNSDANDKHA